MGGVFKKSYTKLDPSTERRVLRKTKKWYVKYRDGQNLERVEAGYTDKAVTKQLLAKLEQEADAERRGFGDRFKTHRARPLAEHLESIDSTCRIGGPALEHVATTEQRVRAIIAGGGFTLAADVTSSGVERFLAKLRDQGKSLATSNHYLTALKMFFNWMVKDGRLAENPVRFLSKRNVQVDRRRVRRALSADELVRLLEATAVSPPRGGLTGESRARLYLLAAYTGLRRNEIASLDESSFNFASDPPTVTIKAADSKHRRCDTIPIRRDFADCVSTWFAERSPEDRGKPLFPIVKARTADWIRADLEAAGLSADDAGKLTIDFHALRQTFITNLSRAGVSPKLSQVLARHSDINLTMNTYTTLGMAEQKAAVESLPPVPRPRSVNQSAAPSELAPKLVLTEGISGPTVASDGTEDEGDDFEPDFLVRRKNRGKTAAFSTSQQVPKEGLEPSRPLRTLDFESSASAIPPLRLGRETDRWSVFVFYHISSSAGNDCRVKP